MKKVLSVFMIVLSLFACGKSSNEDNTSIKVGVPLPLTGDLAQYGVATKNGIELAIEQINQAGGINGKMLVADYQDTKGDIQEVVSIFKKMNSNKVDVFIGEAISSNSIALAELSNTAKVPTISPTATALDVTKDKEYVFRTTFTDDYQGMILAKYMAKLGVKKAAILINNSSDYSLGVAQAFKDSAMKSGIEIFEQNYTGDDKDFKSLLVKIKNSGYKDVVIPDYYGTIGLILSQAEEIGLDAQYYGADGWDGIQADFARLAQGAIFSSQFAVDDDSEIVRNFITDYKKKFDKDPLIFSALGYDSVLILKSALEKGPDLKENLKKTDLNLVTGQVRYDENRNPNKKVTFIQIDNGKLKLKEKFGE